MKTHNNSSGVWYGPDHLSSLINRYAPNIKILLSASTQLGLSKQLDHIGQEGQYFIPLNINCLSQNFEDGSRDDLQNNHWAGLYVVKEEHQTTVTYLDPMGKKIGQQLAFQIYNKFSTGNINYPLLDNPIQLVQLDPSSSFIKNGNDTDCGPFLVYCVASVANGKGIRQDIKTLGQSASFGQYLREAFSKEVSFNEIYHTIQPFQDNAAVIRKAPSSKAAPPSVKAIEPKLPEIEEEINDAEIPQINEIIEKIELGNKQIHSEAKKAILVIGKTGAGKSTLVNYLTNPENLEVVLNKDLENSDDEGDLVIDVIESKKANLPKIGHKKDSETTVPNKWQSEDGQLTYWDPPGFDGTKGPEQEIPDAFYIKKIFDIAKKIKLMLTITYSDLENSRANDIKRLADTLGNLFNKDEIKEIIKGLSLVVTKAGNKITEKKVKAEITKILKTDSFKEDSVGKIILESLKGSENKIAIFRKPKEEGDLTEGKNKELLGSNNNILKVIENTTFITTPKVNIAVSGDSKNETIQLCTELNKLIVKESEKVAEWFKFYCKKFIKIQDKAILPEGIPLSIGTSEEFLSCLRSIPKVSTKRVDNIEKYIKYIDFLKQIGAKEVTYQLNDWAKPLLEVGKVASSWLDLESNLREDGCLEIKGVLVDSSRVMKEFRAQKDQDKEAIKSVEVYAGNTVFLDEDLKDNDLKGKNVAIIAPRWKVLGKKTIDLSGKEGNAHQNFKAKDAEPVAQHQEIGIAGKLGSPGEDGLPGLPGYNGGNFFGVGKKFIGLQGLTIDVSGGKGGKGQDGGDGSDGTNSTKDGTKEDVTRRETKALKNTTECMLKNDTVSRLCEEYESHGEDGGIGGSSGMGGRGGIGGYAGQILLKSSAFLKPQVLLTLGCEGNAGAPGNPGQGGDSGRIYYGEYVNEKIVYTEIVKKVALAGKQTGERVGKEVAGDLGKALLGTPSGLLGGLLGGIGVLTGGAGGNLAGLAGKMVGEGLEEAIVKVGVAAAAAGVAGLGLGGLGVVATGVEGLGLGGLGTAVAGLGFLGGLGVGGVGGIVVLVTGEQVLKSYKNSGWQGEIKHKVEKASAGQIPKEKNPLSLKYPKEPDNKWVSDHDQIIIRYQGYIKNIDKYLVKKVIDFSSLKDTNIVCIEKHTAEQLFMPYKVTKTTEQEIKAHSFDSSPEFDLHKNAFNQKENIKYYYQMHDLEVIQEMVMGNYQSDFIIYKLIKNKLLDHCTELKSEFAEQSRPCLSIVDIGNCNWINIGSFKVQDQPMPFVITNFSEESHWQDSGVLALSNMRIAAEKILDNLESFAQDLGACRGFCTLEEVPKLRVYFGNQYALAVYRHMFENGKKNIILGSCSKYLENGLVKLKETLNGLEISGDSVKVIMLKTGEKLDRENQQKIDNSGGKLRIGSTVAIKLKVMSFSLEPKSLEYCYKISWTQDLNWGEDIIDKLCILPPLGQLGEIIANREHNTVKVIPPEHSNKYECELKGRKIPIRLDKLCKKLHVKPTNDIFEELREIIREDPHYADIDLIANDAVTQSGGWFQGA